MIIFAVDDEAGALQVLVDAIRRVSPHDEIYQFSSSQDALKYAQQVTPDIAFVDIYMSGMIGTELARNLKKINPKLNVIFATGYSDYAVEALNMHASGYLMKPISARDVQKEMDNLRHPIELKKAKIYAQTFGHFEFFVNDQPVQFGRKPAKEVLAYLIDCKGATVTRKELAAILFEDDEYTRNTQNYITQIIKDLTASLKAVGAEDILVRGQDAYGIHPEMIGCDAYDYFKGDPAAINAFYGEYMIQYSWAEMLTGKFYK